MKSYYFALKMLLLGIVQNVAVYLFKYFVLPITVIPRNDTFIYYRKNQISLSCLILRNVFWHHITYVIVNKCLNG